MFHVTETLIDVILNVLVFRSSFVYFIRIKNMFGAKYDKRKSSISPKRWPMRKQFKLIRSLETKHINQQIVKISYECWQYFNMSKVKIWEPSIDEGVR